MSCQQIQAVTTREYFNSAVPRNYWDRVSVAIIENQGMKVLRDFNICAVKH